MPDPKKIDVDTDEDNEDKRESTDTKADDKSAQRQEEKDAERETARHHEDAEDRLGFEADSLFDSKLRKSKKDKGLDDAELLLKSIFADALNVDKSKEDEPKQKDASVDSPISQVDEAQEDVEDISAELEHGEQSNGNGKELTPDVMSDMRNLSAAPLQTVAGLPPEAVAQAAPELMLSNTAFDTENFAPDERPLVKRSVDLMDFPSIASVRTGENKWEGFRIGVRSNARDQASEMKLPSGDVLIIGRSSDSEINISSEQVSRRHALLSQVDGKVIIQDLGSKNGTAILRDGKTIPVDAKGVELKPGDQIRLGRDILLPWGVYDASKQAWKPGGYKAEKIEPNADQSAKDQADIAASQTARDASNVYLKNHEFSGRIPDGFQVVGGQNRIDENGHHNDKTRPSYVVDTRPGKDPALTKFIEECKKELSHLKDRPEELAREIAKRAKAALEPSGWSDKAVDEGYYKLRAEHAGGRLMLGDFLEAAKNRTGAGVCNHQAVLTKVVFDSFYPNDSERPQMKVIKGYCGGDPAGLAPEYALNHAWTTLAVGGREKIFDPRQMIYGEPREARPSHQPGLEVPQLRPQDAPAKPVVAGNEQNVYDRLIGQKVGYSDLVWQVKSIDAKSGKAVIVGSGSKDASVESVNELNPGRELRLGETYKLRRTGGAIDDGWRLIGYKDPDTKKDLVFTKDLSYERTVSIEDLKRNNEAAFAEAQRQVEQKVVTPPVKAEEAPAKAKEYGLEPGREVSFGSRKWIVNGIVDGKIELVRPSERIMGSEEYRKFNGDHVPKPGEEVNYQRSTGEIQKWRVVAYDEASGEVRVRHEQAVKTKVALPELLHENPAIREAHKSIDVKSILADPRSRVNIDCRWTDGNSGHNLFIGSVEGPNGERIKVMIHKPPAYVRDWVRADNDLAAQKLAERMGSSGLFPATVMRDGMMIQKFVGVEGSNLHTFLHNMSREDAALRAKYSHLDERVFHMMDKIDPKLRTEIARTVAFSALMGDHDQHGLNFVVERTGPNPGDVAIARIDTDYAFNKDGTPQIDRKGNYGGSINGVFRYFSEREIPAEVRAQIKKVSDELNPQGQAERMEARERFARETKLSIAQVNALAERALTLSETGKFPKSIDVHAPEGTNKAADIIGTAMVSSFDMNRAAQDLAKAGIKPEAIERLKTAHANLLKEVDVLSKGEGSGSNRDRLEACQSALNAIEKIGDTRNGMDVAKRQALLDLVSAVSKDASLPIDLAKLSLLESQKVVAVNEIAQKLAPLDQMRDAGMEPALVERIKSEMIQLAQAQPDKIPELTKAIDVLKQPGFAKNFGPDRMRVFADLINIPMNAEALEIPYSHFLDPKVSKEVLEFARSRYLEVAPHFKAPHASDTRGNIYEYNASIAAMKACKEEIPSKGKLVFIPAAHGSNADACGIDGIFLDPKGDRVYPIDWTRSLYTKEAKGKAIWAGSPAESAIGNHVPPDGTIGSSLANANETEMRSYVQGFVGKHPSIEASTINKDMRSSFLSFGRLGPDQRYAESVGIKRFHDYFRGQTPANPVLAELYHRANSALPHYNALKALGDRLVKGFEHDAISSAWGGVDLKGGPGKSDVSVDTGSEEYEPRRSAATGKPMKYKEVELDNSVLKEVHKVRLYEDGSIIGMSEFRDKTGRREKQIDLGHISDLAHIVEAQLDVARPAHTRLAQMKEHLRALCDVSASNPIDFKSSNELARVFEVVVSQSAPLSQAANRINRLGDILQKAEGIDEATASEIYKRTGGKKEATEVIQRMAAVIEIESKYKVDTKTADAILSRQEAIVKAEKVDAAVAREAAMLEITRGVSAKDAVELSMKAAEIRALKPSLSAEQGLNIAYSELAVKTLMPEASGQSEFSAALKAAIENAKPGEELKSIYEHLKLEAHERATANKGSEGWFHTYYALDEMSPEKLGKALGIPDGANAELIKERLGLIQERLKEREASVTPSAVESLNVNKSLLNEGVIGRFHEKVNEISNSLRNSPLDAGARLRDSVFDFLKAEGIKDSLLIENNTDVEISKDATKATVEYSTAENKKVTRSDGKFYVEGSKTEIAPDKVMTKIVLPEGLVRGNVGELSRAVYSLVVEQTSRGTDAAALADRAGVRDFVSKSLARHVELPSEVGTVTGSATALDVSKLPPLSSKVAALEITSTGVKIGGFDRDVTFAELWEGRIKGLKEKLQAEEGKAEKDQDKRKIAELKVAIDAESKFVDQLKIADKENPDRIRAEARAREIIKGFRPSETDIERLAGERGPGGAVRGKLVALTILASAFIAYREKAAAAAPPAEIKAGAYEGRPAPDHESVPEFAPEDAGLKAGFVPDVMEKPGSGYKRPTHEDLADNQSGDKAKDAADKTVLAKLDLLPDRKMTTDILMLLLPGIQRNLAIQNEKALLDKKAGVPIIDEKKLKDEWDRGEFGPESKRLWQEASKVMENESLDWMKMLDMRGLQFPPGAVYGPGISESGSQMREGDALFRARLRAGDVKPNLNFSEIKDAQLPTEEDVAKFIRAFAWTIKAQASHNESVLAGQVAYTQESLSKIPSLKPVDWNPPKDGSLEEMLRWRAGALPWIETANRVRTYAETIAAFNAATTTHGRDWPSLNDFFKWQKDVGAAATTFPDDALKDPDFPGKLTRNSNGTVKVELDMPEGIDRNNPANIAKIEKMERWLTKWSPAVDKVTKELTLALAEKDRLLVHVEEGDFEREHKVKKEEVEAFKKANLENPKDPKSPTLLKGDESDVGKFVRLADGQGDWRVLAVKPDGSYELGKRAPNGEEFNLKRYSFDSVPCDKDGKENPKGDYVKVTGYQDYQWARFYSYNNWWGVDSVHKKPTMEAKVFHKNDYVPIFDNGRMRLMPAGKLSDWQTAQERAKQTGNVVNATVDAGMIVSGLYEARAAAMAAKAMKMTGTQVFKAAVKEGAWHFALGATGFGKQAIENLTPFGYGRKINEARHYVILADISIGMLPAGAQKAVWNSVNVFKWGRTAKEAESAVEAYKLGRVVAAGTEVKMTMGLYDTAVRGAHKLYEGWKLPVIGRVLPIGVFPLADCYFLAQFSDTAAAIKDKNDPQRAMLFDAMERHKIARDKDKPLYANPSEATDEQFKQAMKPTIDEYIKRLGNKNQSAESEQIGNAAKEAIKLPANNPDRVKLSVKLAEEWKTATDAKKYAIAAALLNLSKDAEGKYPEQVMGISTSDLQQKLARSPEAIAHKSTELLSKSPSDEDREAYRQELANIYKNPSEPSEKYAAAKALLQLSMGKDGKLSPLDAKSALDINDVATFNNRSAEGLLSRLTESVLKSPDDADRKKLLKDADDKFWSGTEREKVAAAIVLLSLRGNDSLTSQIPNTNQTVAGVLDYLNKRVRNSDDPEVKIAVGDLLFRTAQMGSSSLNVHARMAAEGEKKYNEANEKLAKDPDNEDLKTAAKTAKDELEQLRNAQNDVHDFLKKVNYNAADFASTLMAVIQSDKTPRQVKLDAIASANGPRLAAILQHLKASVEPALLRETDDNARIDGLSGLYGRDSKSIEKFLRGLSSDLAADKDVRALASQALSMVALDRTTVNGIPVTPGSLVEIGSKGDVILDGPGIVPSHAVFKIEADGKQYVAAKDGPVWIARNGDHIPVPKGKLMEVKSGDSVIVGDKDKGRALFLSNEQTDAIAELSKQSKLLGSKPGAISDAYVSNLRKILENPLPPNTDLTPNQRVELLVARLQAAQAAKDLGPEIFGDKKDKAQKIIGDALADCIQTASPEISIAALVKIDAATLANMSVEKADQVRESTFKILKNTPTTEAGFALREVLLNKMPELFEGASKAQQSKAQRYLEALLMPEARQHFRSFDSRTLYPDYVAGRPELRVSALDALTKMNPDKAADLAKLLLSGGDYQGHKVQADFPVVRLQAVKTLEKALPLEVHEIALQALRTEKDPAVLARLRNLEYGQRPDMDPVKAMEEVERLESRVRDRAKPGLLNDGLDTYNKISRNGSEKFWVSQARSLALGSDGFGKMFDPFKPECVEARKALIYAVTHPELHSAEIAAAGLYGPIFNAYKDMDAIKKYASELAGPLEAALLNNPSLSASARHSLVDSYMGLKPGENGVVSKDEAAIVLARVLEAELKRMPRIPLANYDEYGKSVALQEKIVEALRELKSEKIAPILDALSHKEPIKSVDAAGRPQLVDYAGNIRKFEYDSKDRVVKFTEYPSGKVFERDSQEPQFFKTKSGEKIEAPSVQLNKAETCPTDRYQWSTFDRFNVKGDFGDFTYKKDGKSYVQKVNGMLIEEELSGNTRKITLTYPGGKETKEFVFTGDEKKVNVSVTTKPANSVQTWSLDKNYGSFVGKGADGQILSTESLRGMNVLPWNFDKGTLLVLEGGRGGTLRFTDANGAVYTKSGSDGTEQKVFAGYGDAAAHPLRSVSSAAKILSNNQSESNELARKAAELELRYAQKNDPASIFNSPADANKLADFMGKALADRNADGYTVSKSLHMAMFVEPIKGEDDPRLTVLREALRDKNDMVRLTAAQYLMDSPVSLDRNGIAEACADIVKNGSSTGRAKLAQSMLDQLKRIDSSMVEKAISDTPDKPRLGSSERPDNTSAVGNAKYQQAFERIRASLLEGPKDVLSWEWGKWGQVAKELNSSLLTWSGRFEAERQAVNQMLSNLGGLTKFLMGREELEAKKKDAKANVINDVWSSFDQLMLKAMKDGDDSQSVLARKALAFIVMSNGKELGLEDADKVKAVDKAVDAITKICKDSGPGRGDMTWIVQSLLTEKIDLSADNKKKVVDALDSLADPNKGKMNAEVAAGIAALALEQEMRFMPRQGQAGYNESVAYQNRLLDTLQRFGNKEMIPALKYFATQHSDASVRESANKAHQEILKRKNDGIVRIVDQMVSSESSVKFPSIRSAVDQRVPFLVSALNDPKLSEIQRVRAAELLLSPENRGLKETDLKLAASVYAKFALSNKSEELRYKAADFIMDKSNGHFTEEHQFAAARVMAELSQGANSEQIRARAALISAKLDGADSAAAAHGSLDAVKNLKADSAENTARLEKALEETLRRLEASDKLGLAQAAIVRAATLSSSTLGASHPLSKKFATMFAEMAESKTPLEIKDAADSRLAPLKDAINSGDHNLKMAALEYTLKANGIKRAVANDTIKLAVEETTRLAMGESADKPYAISLMKNLRSENLDVALARITPEFPKQEAYDLLAAMPKEAAAKVMNDSLDALKTLVRTQRNLAADLQQDHEKMLKDPKYGELIKNYMKAIGESSDFKLPPHLALRPEILQSKMEHMLKLYGGSNRSPEAEAQLLKAYSFISQLPESKSPQLSEMGQILEKAALDMKARPLSSDDPRLSAIRDLLQVNGLSERIRMGLAVGVLDANSGVKVGDPLRIQAYKVFSELSESNDAVVKSQMQKHFVDAIARISNPIDKNDEALKELLANLPGRGAEQARLELANKVLAKDTKLTKDDYKLWSGAWKQVISCLGSSDASVSAQAKKQIESLEKDNPNKMHLIKEFLEVAQSRLDGKDKRNNEFWETFKSVLDKFETSKSDQVYELVDKWLKANPNTGNEAEDLEKKASNSTRKWESEQLWEQSIAAREKALPADSIELAQARMRYASAMMKGDGYYYNASKIKAQTELALDVIKKNAPNAVETADTISRAAQMMERTRDYGKALSLNLEAAGIYAKDPAKRAEEGYSLAKAAAIQMQCGEMSAAMKNVEKISELLKAPSLSDHDKTMLYAALLQTLKPMMLTDKDGSKNKAIEHLKAVNDKLPSLNFASLSKEEAERAFEAFWWIGQTITDNRESTKEQVALTFNAYEKALEAGLRAKGEKDTSTIGLFNYYASVLERNGQPDKAAVYRSRYEKMMAERTSVPAGAK